jgi:probable phosphoglycerate mutase
MMPDAVVYLVRHGRTHLNAEAVLRGHLDVALDDQGRHQAQRLGHTFGAVKVEAVISSLVLRARQTAATIAVTTRAPLTIEPRVIDRDYRDWAGSPSRPSASATARSTRHPTSRLWPHSPIASPPPSTT